MRDLQARFLARVPLFDRLGGADNRRLILPTEEPYRALTLAGIRESVTNSIADLLTQRAQFSVYDVLVNDVSNRSVTNFGLPDFGYISDDQGQQLIYLRETIQRTIAAFEPRLQNVVVSFLEGRRAGPTKAVRIEGTLVIGSYREPMSFPTVSITGPVRGGAHGRGHE